VLRTFSKQTNELSSYFCGGSFFVLLYIRIQHDIDEPSIQRHNYDLKLFVESRDFANFMPRPEGDAFGI
jgi:hypothetical protein